MPPVALSYHVNQARNQKFFRAGEVSSNLDISINISPKTQEKKASQGKILEFFLLETLKTTFLIENLAQRWIQSRPFFKNRGTDCIFLTENFMQTDIPILPSLTDMYKDIRNNESLLNFYIECLVNTWLFNYVLETIKQRKPYKCKTLTQKNNLLLVQLHTDFLSHFQMLVVFTKVGLRCCQKSLKYSLCGQKVMQ